MISFDLGDAEKNEDSFAMIGGLDLSNVVDKKIYSYPIDDNEYWQIPMGGIKYGGESLTTDNQGHNSEKSKINALIDTGTSLLSLPADMY